MHLHLNLQNIRIYQSRRSQAVSAVVKRRRRHRRADGDEASISPANIRRGAVAWQNLWLKLPNLADSQGYAKVVPCQRLTPSKISKQTEPPDKHINKHAGKRTNRQTTRRASRQATRRADG